MSSSSPFGSLPLGPPEASNFAPQVDRLFAFALGVSCFSVLVILCLIVYFIIRYRRRSDRDVPPETPSNIWLEIGWTAGTFIILLVLFFWGAAVYVRMKKPLQNGLEIHVLAKQWMWKFEHPDGIREINALHIPVGRPIKLIMATQDVIHDLFIPAFRIKQDIVPGSYMTEWFTATDPGIYHIFCSQYCGTDHSLMVGQVIALEPADYEAWRAGVIPGETPVQVGRELFTTYGCNQCHGQFAPTMAGLYMSKVRLQNGSTVTADEQYLRESITNATGQIVAGYPPIMPSYRNLLTEDQIFDLVAYIKSLQSVREMPSTQPAGPLPRPMPAPSTIPSGPSPLAVPNFPPARTPPTFSPPPERNQP